MIGEDVVDRLFALRAAGPFQRLETAELLLIASHVRTRHYAPGRVILAAGAVADLLVVRVAGAARLGQAEAPEVFDAPGLLFGLPAAADYVAGDAGLDALVIAKPHVFTIARECPEFVVGLRALAVASPDAERAA
ncbi:hypothetical protein [Phenylobacterium sp. SCN 70-31]|uniref:hypothetical protein n=1 Tax=Phenylobacterium sp. SCN 70-31 TaxID=1660129 RepID=UPI00086C1145|nr:hypothetical protein [Phenylobacterium sp. SCN 70-31]ODT85944.1 MAG: Crp/Fnr family transcriptional regulator [Phenylobacterium sp. SCN 70-31]